ncbi:cytidine deaminase [Flavobacterium sp. H122]|uniref:cytidine deaminase n=1 Tax=Flavobacterium sp. H122 TaxID=2529860 RepID=UPI0010AA0181|nr:cytidine deaminase [Flavobacterium sp. H122]
MKEIKIETQLTIFDSINELDKEVKELMEKAIEARKNAYAPYSKFNVGAALLLENGQTVIGSNQENAAYPSGLCAERVAVFHAGAVFPNTRILKIAITAGSTLTATTKPIPPCGSCRQSLFEYEFKQDSGIEVYFMGETGEVYKSDSIQNLLPLTFDKNFL